MPDLQVCSICGGDHDERDEMFCGPDCPERHTCAQPCKRLETPEGRLEAVKEAVRKGNFEIVNPAVGAAAVNPHVVVFDNRDDPRWEGRGRAGFLLSWMEPKLGFGEITFVVNDDGTMRIESEAMSRAFVIGQLKKMVERSEFD